MKDVCFKKKWKSGKCKIMLAEAEVLMSFLLKWEKKNEKEYGLTS